MGTEELAVTNNEQAASNERIANAVAGIDWARGVINSQYALERANAGRLRRVEMEAHRAVEMEARRTAGVEAIQENGEMRTQVRGLFTDHNLSIPYGYMNRNNATYRPTARRFGSEDGIAELRAAGRTTHENGARAIMTVIDEADNLNTQNTLAEAAAAMGLRGAHVITDEAAGIPQDEFQRIMEDMSRREELTTCSGIHYSGADLDGDVAAIYPRHNKYAWRNMNTIADGVSHASKIKVVSSLGCLIKDEHEDVVVEVLRGCEEKDIAMLMAACRKVLNKIE